MKRNFFFEQDENDDLDKYDVFEHFANKTCDEYIEYSTYSFRLKSFNLQPKPKKKVYLKKSDAALIEQYNIRNKFGIIKLAEAGFFYDQTEKSIICFSCSKKASRRAVSDDIWRQHLVNCNFAIYWKGYKFFADNNRIDDIRYELIMKDDFLYGVKGSEKKFLTFSHKILKRIIRLLCISTIKQYY